MLPKVDVSFPRFALCHNLVSKHLQTIPLCCIIWVVCVGVCVGAFSNSIQLREFTSIRRYLAHLRVMAKTEYLNILF